MRESIRSALTSNVENSVKRGKRHRDSQRQNPRLVDDRFKRGSPLAKLLENNHRRRRRRRRRRRFKHVRFVFARAMRALRRRQTLETYGRISDNALM